MKYIYILIMTVLVLSSCLDDKSNLEYHDVLVPDSVFVTDVSNGLRVRYESDFSIEYLVDPGEELQLDPEVFYRGDDEITYEWYSEGKVISTEKNLRHVFQKNAPECLLLVGRKNAGNGHCYQFSVKLREPFAIGIVVLAKDNGKTLLDYVERSSKKISVDFQGLPKTVTVYNFTMFNDIYASCNDGASLEGHDPVRLFRYSGYANEVEKTLKGVQVVDKDWRSSVMINLKNMEKLISMKDEFIDQPQNLQIADFINLGAMTYMLTESGEIYTRVNYDNGNPSTGRFSTFPLAYNDPYDAPDKGPIDIKADKLFFGTPGVTSLALAYEKDKKRFLLLSAASATGMNSDYSYITDFSRPKGGVGIFPEYYVDLNNFDKDLRAVIFPNQHSDNVYFIFKNSEKYYIQCCKFSGEMYNVPYNISNEATNCTELLLSVPTLLNTGNNYFYAAQGRIFFSSGNKIYSMNYTGEDLKTEYESSETSPITKFEIMKPWNEEKSSALNRFYGGRTLGVSFENGIFKVEKVYDDPDKPNTYQCVTLVEKHYNGSVVDFTFYQ